MNTFLKTVACDLYEKTGGDLSRTAVVFPNKRAGLFFNQWLAELSERPVWSPAYLTISDLFRSLSVLRVGDSVELVCILYRIFCEETCPHDGNEDNNVQETLDNFYFWGQLLIADFDDLDKHLVNADQLFGNLADLKKLMDDYSFLTAEQEEALRLFFDNFSPEKKTELKERFLSVWDVLGNVYHRFRKELAERKIAYEGQLYRAVIEETDFSGLPYDRYVFVGFNVLNEVERKLFAGLQKAGKAMFYWDYDRYYVENRAHEAGEFIRRNLQDFPNELTDPELFRHFGQPKEVTYIEASTENAQARYVADWLPANITARENETAVVLCNEALLLPVLHALPEEGVRALNITMGYPLTQTPVHGLLDALIELYTAGYNAAGRYSYRTASVLLKHPYVRRLAPEADALEKALVRDNRFYPLASELQCGDVLTRLFPTEGAGDAAVLCKRLLEAVELMRGLFAASGTTTAFPEEQLHQEALFRCYTQLNRFNRLLEEGLLDVSLPVFSRLIRGVLGNLSVPFHGEPAIGLQVMGVLETRNLDFRHLLMLSVNEGKLPHAEGDSSFIPYNLRKAFGMTTIEHKNAVYAYYFYRLIQRAERVTMVYNTSTDGMNRGEMSRFMVQYLVEGGAGRTLTRQVLAPAQRITQSEEMPPLPAEEVCRRLVRRFTAPGSILSPSALNTYMDCPQKFALHYAYGLRERKEVDENIEASVFGDIFHKAAEMVYKRLLTARGKLVRREDIEVLLKNENRAKLDKVVDDAFREEFFHIGEDVTMDYSGMQLLNREVILTYLRQLLVCDRDHTPFTFCDGEIKVETTVSFTPPGADPLTLTLGGNIDRMDEKEGTLRIIDYKTGSKVQTAKTVEQLFDTTDKKRPYHIFQVFLYALLKAQEADRAVIPGVFYIQKSSSADYSPEIRMDGEPVEDIRAYAAEYAGRLRALLEEIFSPHIDFLPTGIEEHCKWCAFARLCGKEAVS